MGDIPSNELPSDTAVQTGGAGPKAASVKCSGNLWSQVFAGGSPPAGINADYVVAVASIPAAAFDAAGRTIDITAFGSFAANADSKTAKLIVNPTTANIGSAVVGGTTIASTGAVTTNGGGWKLGASITKTGAKGSNTQNSYQTEAQTGAAVDALQAPSALTLNESNTITVALTIDAVTTATDCEVWSFKGRWSN